MRTVGIPFSSPLAVKLLAAASGAFAIHYYLLHELFGPLTVDEAYFAHVFWLLRHGQAIYTDFYANHLPTYFLLLNPLLPAGSDSNLDFVWALRATGLAAALAYVAMLWTLARRDFLYLLPVLLLFLVFARMTEIRPDTAGLLLFNTAWWLLLTDTSRRNLLVAALLAGLALTFTARAPVMAIGMGTLMLALCAMRRDHRTPILLTAIGIAFLGLLALAFFAAPDRFGTIVRMVYLDPIGIMPDVPISTRLLRIDRLLMVALILLALAAAVRRRREARSLVILFACTTQLALILVDPSPFQYVYGWAALPTLAGLSLLGDRAPARLHAGLTLSAAMGAVLVASLSFAGPTPRPGSIFRLTYDRPFAGQELASVSTQRLLQMATRSERQQGLWNQLALFGEICRRIPGPVLTRFYANMICQRDSLHDWAGLRWPPIFEDDPSTAPRAEFQRLFSTRPPALVAWGKQDHVPKLNPWGRALLADYDIYEGYALKRQH
ncbi:MAG TPA: hypothetical protein VFK50_10875 [Sphingomicrobium sp.]|nr:hypothetical protein [Sphingomicrobium sp.]